MAIQQTLKKLGLNDKEIKVYLTLLRHGKTKPSVLAGLTKLNRATLYNVADGLLSKGIIANDLGGKTLLLAPLPPESLGKITEQSKRELEEKEALVEEAITELAVISAEKEYPVPKIRFVEEKDLEKFLFDNLERWQTAVVESDGVWWGFQDESFSASYEKWINSTWRTDLSQDAHYNTRFFSNLSPAEQKLAHRHPKDKRAVKYLIDSKFSANTWVCGDYLVMISTKQHPHYLVEIHDALLAHNLREVFKQLWKKV